MEGEKSENYFCGRREERTGKERGDDIRRVCHDRQHSVPDTGPSNKTPHEMDYRGCVCLDDRVGKCFHEYNSDTVTEWCRCYTIHDSLIDTIQSRMDTVNSLEVPMGIRDGQVMRFKKEMVTFTDLCSYFDNMEESTTSSYETDSPLPDSQPFLVISYNDL